MPLRLQSSDHDHLTADAVAWHKGRNDGLGTMDFGIDTGSKQDAVGYKMYANRINNEYLIIIHGGYNAKYGAAAVLSLTAITRRGECPCNWKRSKPCSGAICAPTTHGNIGNFCDTSCCLMNITRQLHICNRRLSMTPSEARAEMGKPIAPTFGQAATTWHISQSCMCKKLLPTWSR